MARFNALLQSLVQPPAFQEGLFEAAKGIGMSPVLAKAEQERKQQMQAFQNMTPVQRADFMVARAKTPQELMTAEKARTAAIKVEGNAAVQPLLTELSDPETSDERAKEIRQELFDTGRQYEMDESELRQGYTQANQIRILSEVEKLEADTRRFSILAKQAIGTGLSREAFVSEHGTDAGFVYDAEKTQKELNDASIAEAKENLRKSTYQYSDKILSEPPFSFSEAEINQINALVGGERKNAQVFNIVASKTKPQNAALITAYAKSLYNQVAEDMGWDFDDEDERMMIESEAYRRVLSASNRDGNAGIAGLVAQQQEQEADSTPEVDLQSAIDELVRELGNQPD